MNWELYTDGACPNNGQENAKGGWAYIILKDGKIIYKENGNESSSTNQRMELTAAIKGCNKINSIDPFARVYVYSDSAYLVNCWKQNWWRGWIAKGWKNSKKEPVANQELWQQLIPFLSAQPNGYEFIKVKGHENNFYNNMCDTLAVEAARG